MAANTAAKVPQMEPANFEASPAKGVIEGETPLEEPTGELPILPEGEIVPTGDDAAPLGSEPDEPVAEDTIAVVVGATVEIGAEVGVEAGAAEDVVAEESMDVEVAAAELDAGTAVAAHEQTACAEPMTATPVTAPQDERTQPFHESASIEIGVDYLPEQQLEWLTRN